MEITLVQASLQWENPEANRQHLQNLISLVREGTGLVVLPEMFSTGFTMNPGEVAEPVGGPTTKWMKAIAKEKNCAVTGSVAITEGDHYYNRLLFVFPDGQLKYYDKRHLFTLAGEDKVFTAGRERPVIEYQGWKICPLICYDLRFPVFSRNTEDYDLLLYVANWPAPRIQAWDVLLQARAIENMCYVAGVNRIGQDGNGHNYPGHSQVYDTLGNPMLEISENEGIYSVTLSKEAVSDTRKRFGFLNDRDRFTLLY
ncbi:amidohydrolase [Flavobacterium cyanobacteriorum]|uniref:Omega-amidase YafV n=1 Tax=Flavobacterium cyanobacteriorum TaxID=2022802 RepID=A0A255Z808_9FLAO|nr:amidohydrolase [Flavobacterium cyanobacteriorum]OYQ37015.1 amidohydrolase [Flavobacterium cyanobacteriorum]